MYQTLSILIITLKLFDLQSWPVTLIMVPYLSIELLLCFTHGLQSCLNKLLAPTLLLSYWTNLVTVSYGTIPYDVLRGQEPSQYVSGRQRKQASEA